jgi:hypothetical protein
MEIRNKIYVLAPSFMRRTLWDAQIRKMDAHVAPKRIADSFRIVQQLRLKELVRYIPCHPPL